MAPQLFFEDVTEKMAIPARVQPTSSRLSVMWAAASGDFDPIHYDQAFARGQRLPDMIVNGRLKLALLSQMITIFMGPQGRLRKISARHQSMDIVGQPLTLKGVVTRKYQEQEENFVECEIWVENPAGERTSCGSATVALPSRK